MAANFSKNGIIQGVIDFFCLVCETNILSTTECEEHVYTAEHEKKFSITAYYKGFEEDCIRKIKNKYFCELCNKFLPVIPRVRLHVKDPKHIDNKNIGWLKRVDGAIVAFNELVIDDTAWHGLSDESCIICNTECDDNDIHKKLPSHILNLLQMKVDFDKDKNIYRKIDEFSFQCLTCNVIKNVRDITNHYDSPTHQNLLQISYKAYELLKVCTRLDCEPKNYVNKSIEQTDACLYSNNQVHVENSTQTKRNILQTIALKLNEEEAAEEKRTKNIFKYTFGDICEEELFKIFKVEQTDIPSYNQVDIENPAEIEHYIPETVKLEPNEENIGTTSKNGSTKKVLKYTFGDISEEELFKILKVKACTKPNCESQVVASKSVKQTNVCLLLNNQVDIEKPPKSEPNITDTIKLGSNEKNTKTNTKGGSNHEAEEITKKVFEYTFGDIPEEELCEILKANACTKSNCEAKYSVNKSDEQTVVCLLSKNQVDIESPAEIVQNILETIELEPNEENIEINSTDSLKSNYKAKNSVNKSNEQTDALLPLKNQVDIENPAEIEQNILETTELELNEDNIETDSSESNCEPKDSVDKSDEQTVICLLSKNHVDIESTAEIIKNIPETIELEPNEENVEKNSTDSLKSKYKAKHSVNNSDEQSDALLPLKNQIDIENPAEIEQNVPKTIKLELNEDNIETDSSKSNCEPKDSVNISDEQTIVCLLSKNQVDIESPAEIVQNILETIELEPNEENIEINSTDSLKSKYKAKDSVYNSDEQTDALLPLKNQIDIENPAEIEQNVPETIKLELNEDNIETDSSKSNCEPKDSVNISDEQTVVCLLSKNQVDIESPAEIVQNILETIELEPNEENIEINSTDSLKSKYKAKDSVYNSDEQTDALLPLKNQTDIENPAEIEQNVPETIKLELNEDNNETDSSKSNCEPKDSVNISDEQTVVCLLSKNQVDIESPAEIVQNILETIELEPNEENIEINSTDSLKSKYKAKDSVYNSDEQTDALLPLKNQIDIEKPAEIEQNVPETIKLELNEDNIETDSSKSNCEPKDSVTKSDEQTVVCLLSKNHIDIKSPAEIVQNILETIELEPNEENIEVNSTDRLKLNYKAKDRVKKSDEQTDVSLPSKNQIDIENPAEIEQNIIETTELELKEDNIETDSSKSNCEPKDSVNKSDEQTVVCLLSKNQVDIESPAEIVQNILETIELEPNEENIEINSTDSLKSNYKTKDRVNKSDEQTDALLPLKNQVDIENPAEIEQNIPVTTELELNEDNVETDSSESNCEPKDSVDKSDEQTVVCLLSKNQADIEIPAETQHNNPETIVLKPNEENIETNSREDSKSYCEPNNGVSKSDQQSNVSLASNNQVDVEYTAETENNNSELIALEPNEENIETYNSKIYCEPKDSIHKSNEQTDVCLVSNNQVDVENPANITQNIPETIVLEPTEENIGTNSNNRSKDIAEDTTKNVFEYKFDYISEEEINIFLKEKFCAKSNSGPKDDFNKSVEQIHVCLPLNEQVDIESSAKTEQKIPEIMESELNDENIKTNSKDSSKDVTEETIKNIIENKLRDICENEIFKLLKVTDCINLEENNKSWCILCNLIVDSSAVAEHLNGRHHKLQKLHKEKAKRRCKKYTDTKICTENNNINDCHEKILNSESNNKIEISLGIKTAFCKKCLVILYYDNNDVKNHILEHFEKDENIDEDSIIFTAQQELVKNETLSSCSVLPEGNEIENTSELNGNESVKVDKISDKGSEISTVEQAFNDKVRQENIQITEEKSSIQQIKKLINTIEKIPTHSFIDYIMYAKNSMQGVNFCDIIINKSIYMNYTSFSFITVYHDYMKCHYCDEIFTIFTLEEHYMSTKHDVAMRDTPVLMQYDSEFLREIRPGYIHCGFCNAIESIDDIETHLNSVNHKECKGVASWRLHLYQPLIGKTGFQTIYAKHGISRALSLRNLK